VKLLLQVVLAVQCSIGVYAVTMHDVGPAHDEHEGRLLAWVAGRVPRRATLILVGGTEPMFFRASSELYPRTVIWLSPGLERWALDLPRDQDGWRRLIERTDARFVFIEGGEPTILPQASDVATFDVSRGEHLATLADR
jgi:hypothetical protein